MISFKDFLLEALDRPYNYNWRNKGKKGWVGTFHPKNFEGYYELVINFDVDDFGNEVSWDEHTKSGSAHTKSGSARINFYLQVDTDSDDITELTGTGDSFRVMATIAEMIREILNEVCPASIEFSAKESSRVILYRRLANQIKSNYGYKKVKEHKLGNVINFEITSF